MVSGKAPVIHVVAPIARSSSLTSSRSSRSTLRDDAPPPGFPHHSRTTSSRSEAGHPMPEPRIGVVESAVRVVAVGCVIQQLQRSPPVIHRLDVLCSGQVRLSPQFAELFGEGLRFHASSASKSRAQSMCCCSTGTGCRIASPASQWTFVRPADSSSTSSSAYSNNPFRSRAACSARRCRSFVSLWNLSSSRETRGFIAT